MEKKKLGKNIIYNSIGTFTYLFCQWLITFIVVWISGYKTAGVFSLAMSITTTFAVFSTFNMRNYQSSDYNGTYSEKTYLSSRFFTCVLSIVLTIVYCLFLKFNLFQFFCIIIYMFFKLSEALVDVLHGSLQRKWRFDIIGISYFVRGILSILLFSIILFFTKNLIFALIAMTIGVYIFIYFYDIHKYRYEFKKLGESSKLKVFQLLIQCVPLVLYAFLLNYYSMYPRVLANEMFGTKILGYYASVATPAVIVQVAASFIFTPLITLFSEYYNEKKYNQLFKTMFKVIVLTLIIGLCALCVSSLFCNFAFKILFGEEILKYTYLFNGVIVVSTLMALIWLLAMILTVSRDYFKLVIGTIISLIITVCLSKSLLSLYFLNGINYVLIISYLIQIIVFIVFILSFKRRKNNKKNSVLLILDKNLINNKIINKELIDLKKQNFYVNLLCEDLNSKKIDKYKKNDVNTHKYYIKTSNSNFIYKLRVLIFLLKNNRNYNCIHICDSNCISISFIIALLCNKKLIYDKYFCNLNSTKISNKFENAIINYSNIIIIDEKYLNPVYDKYLKKTIIVTKLKDKNKSKINNIDIENISDIIVEKYNKLIKEEK